MRTRHTRGRFPVIALALLGMVPILAAAQTGPAGSGGDGAAGAASAPETSLDYAQVRFVQVTETAPGVFRFDVTVRHNDEGWDHYADLWQVVDPASGKILGERELLHPHDNEQPFERSQTGIQIPDGTPQVVVRAECNLHGFGGATVTVPITGDNGTHYTGENYDVTRL